MTRQFKISHPGEIIARDLADMNINIDSFAMNIGVTPASLVRFLAGKKALTPPLAIRIAAAMGNTPEFWMGLQSAHDLRQWEGEIDTSGIELYGKVDVAQELSGC